MSDDNAPAEVPRIQTTYYGYEKPGDPDYDPQSAQGIGDRQNQLEPGKSVALSQPERLARFGVQGKSTGKTFEYNGQTYRDDDSTSYGLTNRRVDIYSPQGIPSSSASSGGAQPQEQQPDALSKAADIFMSELNQPDFALTKVLGGHLGAVNA
jgi:hypothetical protein